MNNYTNIKIADNITTYHDQQKARKNTSFELFTNALKDQKITINSELMELIDILYDQAVQNTECAFYERLRNKLTPLQVMTDMVKTAYTAEDTKSYQEIISKVHPWVNAQKTIDDILDITNQ